jgi:hypothetical protein
MVFFMPAKVSPADYGNALLIDVRGTATKIKLHRIVIFGRA